MRNIDRSLAYSPEHGRRPRRHAVYGLALRSKAVTFANAVSSPAEGTIQAFTDSSTAAWGTTISAGGTNHVLGYYDGTNWTVMGK